MVLDTETANGIVDESGKIDLTDSLVYDIGYAICDKKGNIYLERSFVVAEVFIDYKDIMASAYYAEKIPQYWEDIKSGLRTLARLSTIRKIMADDLKEWNVKYMSAHNARFDDRALKTTIRYLTKSEIRWFLPYGIEVWDTLKMATDTICKQKGYIAFCEENGYMTKHKVPRPRATAEILHRYLSGDNEFEEAHTGLEDVRIEVDILARCFRTHKKMRKKLYED